jgi:hypothetical protein
VHLGGLARSVPSRAVRHLDHRDGAREAGPEHLQPERLAARERLVVDEVGRQLARFASAPPSATETAARDLVRVLGADLGAPVLRAPAAGTRGARGS